MTSLLAGTVDHGDHCGRGVSNAHRWPEFPSIGSHFYNFIKLFFLASVKLHNYSKFCDILSISLQ